MAPQTMANPAPIPAPVPGQPWRGLYIHVPFCFHKCHYCDFYSIVDDRDRQTAFVDRLTDELAWWCDQFPLRPATLFVGGGTPTLLSVAAWQRLLSAIADRGILEHVTEFTVEANPETVTADLLRVLTRGRVNRISIGAQSFDPDLLKMLERWHEPASVARAVALARDAGIDNVNLDLIFAIPGQSDDQLERDLDAALALEPHHLSCYSLIFEPGTPLHQRRRQGSVHPVDEEIERRFYQRVIARLADAGYEHYEVSNWARPARRCAHNLLYWRNADWLGLGPSAASHCDGRRWKNVPHLGRYLASRGRAPIAEEETLPPARSIGERLMLSLRLTEGVDWPWIERHAPDGDARRSEIDRLLALGLLQRTDTHLRLTDEGRLLADSVLAALL
jgi:oxygen-independent coproporphyrinogen III oxidase